jgi:hypothetical protein
VNEDVFNMELRKFLKKLGVTSQREIETAVRDALAAGKLSGDASVKVHATVEIEGLDLRHTVDGDIALQ